MSPGDEKDVDFVTSSDFVYVSWTGKFISTSAPVNSFSVYIGTRPEGEYNTAKGGNMRVIFVGLSQRIL